MELLAGSSHAAADRDLFFKAQLMFFLLAATDGHAKNFSILLERGGGYRFTPFYDVISTWPIIGHGYGKLSVYDAGLAMD